MACHDTTFPVPKLFNTDALHRRQYSSDYVKRQICYLVLLPGPMAEPGLTFWSKTICIGIMPELAPGPRLIQFNPLSEND